MLDPYILSPYPRPPSRVRTNVQMEKTLVIDANPTLGEGWDLQCQLIHVL